MISAIFAVDEEGGMGNNGVMPWPMNKEDMKWFKTKTQGHTVVMGKNTWNSGDMPTPLPGRRNVLITNEFINNDNVVQASGDVPELLEYLEGEDDNEIYVIGGVNILLQAKPVLDSIFLTRIPGTYNCDTTIDIKNYLNGFILKNKTQLESCTIEEYINESV